MLEVEDITEDEKNEIEKLKSLIEDELPPILHEDKSLYYRFLKARDFNLKNAEVLLRKHLSDRKTYIDDVTNDYEPPKHIFEYFPVSFVGFDKEGSAVMYIDEGRADFKGIAALYSFTEICQFVAFNLENSLKKMTEHSKKLGKSATKYSFIINLEHFNLFQATFKTGIEYFIRGLQLYQDNYPERLKAVYHINSSFYFNLVYPLIKVVLASALLQKIHIFGKNGWKEVLLEEIDADILPAFLGGNRTDTDGNPWCTSTIVFGKKIPEELYAKKKNKSIMSEKDVKKLVISRSSFTEIRIHIYEENTHIEWEFETKTKDIAFGLYYQDNSKINSAIEELIPRQRIDTMLSSEAGIYKCSKVGTYIIVFDNSYSWIYSKELYYIIRPVKPSTNDEITN